MPEGSPLFWRLRDLLQAFQHAELSPVEVAREALERITAFDPVLHAFLTPTPDLALQQAREAEAAYRKGGDSRPLLGVPLSIKDLFHVGGVVTTFGSALYKTYVAAGDSGAVRRLRAAGAVFVGKTNTAEFGQSATTENLLRDACRNPWDPTRTAGGSSGGAAASVAAGLASAALGSDGGGSIRIPAAFCGLVGIKPTHGLCQDEDGFRAMTDFVCPGPITRNVEDARLMLGVLADTAYPRQTVRKSLRVAWCPRLEQRPVDPQVLTIAASGVEQLQSLGHRVEEADVRVEGWREIFRVLVLADERRYRGHLLDAGSSQLTDYEARTLEAAIRVGEEEETTARRSLQMYRQRIGQELGGFDLIVTPTTAVPAFPVGQRPQAIDGTAVDGLWGAFPFCVPFNVAGWPAASVPCGLAEGLPVGIQVIARPGQEQLLLDVCQDLEEAIGFEDAPVRRRWQQVPKE